METANIRVVLLGAILLLVVVVAAVIIIYGSTGGRKDTREKLDKIKARFDENARSLLADKQSIRRQKKSGRLADLIDGFIPRKEQLELRLAQAGLTPDLTRYAIICSGLFVAVSLFTLLSGFSLSLSMPLSALVGIGLPYMYVGIQIKSRIAKFTKLFPEAIDMMVRGLRSGLPVNECLNNVAREVPNPIAEEFIKITDSMKLGTQLEEALWEAAGRLDSPDFKFFVISLSVQRETGGNLGETLSNLSAILRQRQAMKLKVKALSSEAKASAWIVGLLPFIMFIMILLINPEYGSVLYTDPKAIVASIGGLIWMAVGVAVMAKMTSFEV